MREHPPTLLKLAAVASLAAALCALWLAAGRPGALARGGRSQANTTQANTTQANTTQANTSQPPARSGGAVKSLDSAPVAQAAQSSALPPELEQKVAELRQRIAGQENKPAEEVFKNIQTLKGVPAGRLLRIMEMGYSRSLGVNCTHCHVVGEWEKDDKPTKNVARDMARMVGVINNDLLKKIKNLQSENPVVNCTTCHRGQARPVPNAQPARP
ncbi:MAG TPA: c-type cytochrome [Pyrinomonadaceae bacterium]|nr:c-type cytochrome [Pyrinomonadaceae bacterium]